MMKQIVKREEGISALEYILIALVVALVIVVGATSLGSSMNSQYDAASTKVGSVPN